MKTALSEVLNTRPVKAHPITVERGLLLLSLSLDMIGCDRDALTLFDGPSPTGVRNDRLQFPREVLELVRRRKSADWSSAAVTFRHGENEYVCRAHLIEPSRSTLAQAMIAIHIERVCFAQNAVSETALKYQLTEREREVLYGISVGLTNKEMAASMRISPNTVRAFVRLIMTKMKLSRRSAIAINVLQNRAPFEQERPANPKTVPVSDLGRLLSATVTGVKGGSSPDTTNSM